MVLNANDYFVERLSQRWLRCSPLIAAILDVAKKDTEGIQDSAVKTPVSG